MRRYVAQFPSGVNRPSDYCGRSAVDSIGNRPGALPNAGDPAMGRGVLTFFPCQGVFDAPVWNKPDQRSADKDQFGDPRREQAGPNCRDVQNR